MSPGIRFLAAALAVAALAGLAASASAWICVPSPTYSTVPEAIRVVGWDGSQTDSHGQFTVVVRCWSPYGPPVEIGYSSVWILFGDCPDGQVAQSQDSLTAYCTERRVFGLTGGNGVKAFRIRGAARPGAPPIQSGCATIVADGVPLRTGVRVSYFDLDGSGGVGAGDVAIWVDDYLSGQYRARSDYDGSGKLDANDLGALVQVALGGGSALSAAPYCP